MSESAEPTDFFSLFIFGAIYLLQAAYKRYKKQRKQDTLTAQSPVAEEWEAPTWSIPSVAHVKRDIEFIEASIPTETDEKKHVSRKSRARSLYQGIGKRNWLLQQAILDRKTL
jgi:hypothetical protein